MYFSYFFFVFISDIQLEGSIDGCSAPICVNKEGPVIMWAPLHSSLWYARYYRVTEYHKSINMCASLCFPFFKKGQCVSLIVLPFRHASDYLKID